MKKILFWVLYSSLFLRAAAQPYPEKIGMGLGGIGGFGMEFIDAAKTIRDFTGTTKDANGNPQTDFQCILFDMRPCCPWLGSVDDPAGFVPALMAGIYRISFTGQASQVTASGASVQDLVYDADQNITTADLVVTEGSWFVTLSFSGTRRTAASAANTGIADLKVLRPGYHNRGDEIYRQEFLNAVAHFPVIRYMDFTETNNSNPAYPATTGWADRNTPAEALFEGEAPWEYVIALANQTATDVWINVPVAATDDYVRELAALLKDHLHPEAIIYFEYSNEVWNAQFDQFAYNFLAAKAEVDTELAGGSQTNLNDDAGQCAPNDEALWRGRRYVRRMKEIGDLFVETFSPGSRASFETKIRPVFAWQIGGWIPYYSCILTWFEQEYGPAGDYFYGLAGAAYVNANGAPDNALPAAILQRMEENSNAFRGAKRDSPGNWLSGEGKIGLKEIADLFGLRYLQYETGPDNGGGSAVNVANRILANRDPGIRDVLLQDLGANWFSDPLIGGDLVMYFVLSSSYTRYGSWGATEEVENLHTPKLKALYELAGIEEDTEPPGFPTNVQITLQGDDAQVTWEPATDNVGVTHYRVSDHRGALATVLADEPLSVLIEHVDPARLNEVAVVAVDAFNNTSTDVVASVGGEQRPPDFTMAPNPVDDAFHIRLGRVVPRLEVSLVSPLGNVVDQWVRYDTDHLEVRRDELPAGLYVVRVKTDRLGTAKVVLR